ncbi:hypothetical protein AK830_g1306 [Neonectria ditissima]|uniref:Uncharacterized protein n=1 Tax=Neonectria ditissima TaxID=78410 RepID=A0A0P7BUM6_9HYPO|nr:hypothetical protein AK830_g1306 [Neonectria ditissima]
MRFYFGILLSFLVVNVSAGGIRGAYECMFVWFAYQAQIDYLMQTDGDLKALQICSGQKGSTPGGTLTFNEFIEYTNRGPNGVSNTNPNVPDADTLQGDKTAQNLYGHKTWLANRWKVPNNIIRSANGKYDTMMLEVSRVVWDIQSKGILNTNIRSAIDAIQKVVISREIDYEKYRMPAMKADPAFTDRNQVTWVTDQLVLRTEKSAEKIDIVDTQAKNPAQPNIAQRIDTWEKTTYFADSTPAKGSNGNPTTKGQVASNHKRAVVNSQRCEKVAKTGHC